MLMHREKKSINYIIGHQITEYLNKSKLPIYRNLLKCKYKLTDKEIANIMIAFDLSYATIYSSEESIITFKYKDTLIKIIITKESITIIIKSEMIYHTIIFDRITNNIEAYYNFNDIYGKQNNQSLLIFKSLDNIKEYSNRDLLPFDTSDQGLLIGFGNYIFTKVAKEWSVLANNKEKRMIL